MIILKKVYMEDLGNYIVVYGEWENTISNMTSTVSYKENITEDEALELIKRLKITLPKKEKVLNRIIKANKVTKFLGLDLINLLLKQEHHYCYRWENSFADDKLASWYAWRGKSRYPINNCIEFVVGLLFI